MEVGSEGWVVVPIGGNVLSQSNICIFYNSAREFLDKGTRDFSALLWQIYQGVYLFKQYYRYEDVSSAALVLFNKVYDLKEIITTGGVGGFAWVSINKKKSEELRKQLFSSFDFETNIDYLRKANLLFSVVDLMGFRHIQGSSIDIFDLWKKYFGEAESTLYTFMYLLLEACLASLKMVCLPLNALLKENGFTRESSKNILKDGKLVFQGKINEFGDPTEGQIIEENGLRSPYIKVRVKDYPMVDIVPEILQSTQAMIQINESSESDNDSSSDDSEIDNDDDDDNGDNAMMIVDTRPPFSKSQQVLQSTPKSTKIMKTRAPTGKGKRRKKAPVPYSDFLESQRPQWGSQ